MCLAVEMAIYRVSHLWTGLSSVTLSAKFCLGKWEFGRSGWARWWNTQIKVNLTQVHEQMGHPVVSMNNFVHKIKGHRPGTLPLAPILPKLISCPVQRR